MFLYVNTQFHFHLSELTLNVALNHLALCSLEQSSHHSWKKEKWALDYKAQTNSNKKQGMERFFIIYLRLLQKLTPQSRVLLEKLTVA
jgi:hypothetical protein